MKIVTVDASSRYNVHIGEGLRFQLGSFVAEMKGVEKVCVVTDSTVYPLYGCDIHDSLTDAGYDVSFFVFPSGEASKNGSTYLSLVQFLAEHRLTRSDLIIALGGGVVGDLAGFAAATYLRGIRFIQMPTTLLAAVDSSVGGKTAIDLPAGKNLVGAFYQPSLVLCDTQTLQTLPAEIFRDGCAEVIKYAVLYDPRLYTHLQDNGPQMDREAVIARCVELKRDAVMADEFDLGLRKKLNLGHTIGHAVEALSGYTVSHGSAVAIGMAIIAGSALREGLCAEEDYGKIISLICRFGLPTKTEHTAEELTSIALSDKKRSGGTVDLIIPRKIGECDIVPTPVKALQSIIQAGL